MNTVSFKDFKGPEDSETTIDQLEYDLHQKSLGVRKIEIISAQYGKVGKPIVFCCIFLVAYVFVLDISIRYTLQAQAQSSYGKHSLLATVNVASSIIAVAAQPIYARLSDIFGRAELLITCIIFYVVGTIIESKAYNVQTYAGGAIIFQFGYTGVLLILQLLGGDFSFLNWRLLCAFVPAMPYIINTWVSGSLNKAIGTRWSMGIWVWAIVFPCACIPLLVCLWHMRYLAKKRGAMDEINQEESEYKRLGLWGFLKYLFFKLDVPGIFLIVAAFALILVPLTLAGGITKEWRAARTIAPLVVGFCCIPAFIAWEMLSPSPVLPFKLFKDRGVWSAFCIGIFLSIIYYMQADYMYSVLMVAVNTSNAAATRITQLYGFVSVVVGAIVGLLSSRIRYLKPFVVFGTCCWVVAMGMLIHFRGGTESQSGIIGSLCFLGFGAGLFTYSTEVLLQAQSDHEHMAVLTSLYFASYYVGNSIGACVSGAIWTQVLPSEIVKQFSNIGIDSEALITYAYGSPFKFIMEYPWGTPERMALVEAYKHVQRLLLITATCLCVPLIGFSLLLRNQKLLDVQNFFDDPNYVAEVEKEKQRETQDKEKSANSWTSKARWIFK